MAAVFRGAVTPLVATDAQTVRPIASVTKAMTALVILETHPLLPGQAGPTLTMTQQDVDDYHSIAAGGGSFAPVFLGEQLTERDLLLGLMLPSANNLALTAARWIDGSASAFVDRLNARASALGMHRTHFADPDGLSSDTTSTAADLVLLGEAVVMNDALLSVVSTTSATLPDGTTVENLNVLLTREPGWVGVKTGWTPAAGGCLLFAARRTLAAGAPPLTMVGAVLDQPPEGDADRAHPELGGAFDVARSAVDSAYMDFSTARVDGRVHPAVGTRPRALGRVLDAACQRRVAVRPAALGGHAVRHDVGDAHPCACGSRRSRRHGDGVAPWRPHRAVGGHHDASARRPLAVVEAAQRLIGSVRSPRRVGAFRRRAQRRHRLVGASGEVLGHADRLQPLARGDELHLVQPKVRPGCGVAAVREERLAPPLTQRARGELPGAHHQALAAARRPQPEPERDAAILRTALASAVPFVGDLRALQADAAHGTRL